METKLCSHRRTEATVFQNRYHLLWLVPTLQWQLSIAFHKFHSFWESKIPTPVYSLGYIVLPCVTSIMDLGIYISFDLKLSAHCSRITATAFGIAS